MKLLRLLTVLIVAFSFSLLLSEASQAANYYISPAGSDSGDGSMSRPWRTIDYASRRLSPGDTLYARGGIYTAQGSSWQNNCWKSPNGTQANPITLKAYPGETPVFDGGGAIDALFDFLTHQWIIIDGITIQNYRLVGMWIKYAASNITIKNCVIRDIREQHAIYIAGYNANGHPGPITIANNRLIGRGLARTVGIHVNHGPSSVKGLKIYNNIVTGWGHSAFLIGSGAEDVEIYNNTLYGNLWGINLDYIGDSPGTVQGVKNCIVKNNIVYQSSSTGLRVGSFNVNDVITDNNDWYSVSGSPIYWSGNVWTLSQYRNGTANGDHALSANPMFVDAGRGDFRLQSSSPVRDRGTAIALAAADNSGMPRPQGPAYDMGAFEYVVPVQNSDTAAPIVTAFSVLSTSTSLTVSILTFNASDDRGVTGYMVTESSASPSASSSGWSSTAPTNYTFDSGGIKTLYAWAKDGTGNVSAAKSASVSISIATSNTIPPNTASYYISPNGSDSGDGSINHPWKTINYASRQLSPGDTLYARGGTYTGQISYWLDSIWQSPDGTEASPITFKAYPGETPIFEGPRTSTPANALFCLNDIEWLVIDGITIRGYRLGIWVASHNAKNITIKNCTFEYIYYSHGIYVAGYSSSGGVTNLTISHNKFNGEGTVGSGCGIHVNHGTTSATNLKIYNNVFYNWSHSAMLLGAGIRGLEIYNNTIYNSLYGINLNYIGDQGDGPITGVQNTVIKNNIVYNTTGMAGRNLLIGSFNVNDVITDYNDWYSVSGSPIYWSGNLWTLSQYRNGTANANNSLSVNPMFVDAGRGDFRLQSSSPVRDRGTAIALAAADNSGMPRPQGPAYDMGAFEYVVPVQNSDTSPPVVTAFSVLSTSTSLTVSILTFNASDDRGVTGYMVTESSVSPSASSSGWSSTAPTNYTFDSGGIKTLYAWAKDGTGNVSAAKSASVSISTGNSDTIPPTAPYGLTATIGRGWKVNLSWYPSSDNTQVKGYLVYRDGIQIAETALSSYEDNDYASDTSHYYAVRAIDTAGNVSQFSNTATVGVQKYRSWK